MQNCDLSTFVNFKIFMYSVPSSQKYHRFYARIICSHLTPLSLTVFDILDRKELCKLCKTIFYVMIALSFSGQVYTSKFCYSESLSEV